MKKLKLFFAIASALSLISGFLPASGVSAASVNLNYIVSDSAFDFNAQTSWTPAQIDGWLNTNFPNGCISGSFRTPDPQGWSSSQGQYVFGGNVTAGTAIYDAAKNYYLDPRILITMLQKEQSIITGSAGCYPNTPDPNSATTMNNACGSGSHSCTLACTHAGGCMNIAMSMGCPNYCDVRYNGFSMQLISGAWLLKFAEQRAYGRTSGYPGYDPGDNAYSYSGPLVPPAGDGSYVTQDGQSLTIGDGATASLYYYNPTASGNTNFFNIYAGWFGNPNTPCLATGNITGAGNGNNILSFTYNQTPSLAYVPQNNTGTACVETHVWNSGYQSWAAHIATGMKANDPNTGLLLSSTAAVDHTESLNYILYSGANGMVEIHRFSPNLQKFPGYYDVATDLSGVTPSSGQFVAGDFFGRGYDQLAYILYSGSSGHVEVHMFDPTMRQAIGYYDVATDLTGVNATTGTFVAGDFFGRGYDQLAYVLYSGSTGKVEVHMFDPTLRQAIGYYDVATDLSGVSATAGTFVAGDFLHLGHASLAYVIYHGSSGQVEVHAFTPDLRRAIGYNDVATNLPGF